MLLSLEHVPVRIIGYNAHLPPETQLAWDGSRWSDSFDEALLAWRHSHLEDAVLRAFFRRETQSWATAADATPASTAAHRIAQETTLELALAAVRPVLARATLPPGDIGAILYCHQTVPDRPAWSLPCALGHALGLNPPRAISVSQRGGTAVAAAMAFAGALLSESDGPASVLLAGVEKFLPPYPRAMGEFGIVGDGSSAYLLSRRSLPGLRVRCVGWHDRPDLGDALASSACRRTVRDELTQELARLIAKVLEQLGAAPREVALALAPGLVGDPVKLSSVTRIERGAFAYPPRSAASLPNGDLALGLMQAQERLPTDERLILALGVSPPASVCCVALTRDDGREFGMSSLSGGAQPCVTATEYVLPDRRITAAQWGQAAGWAPEARHRYEHELGVSVLYVSDRHSALEMAAAAAERLFAACAVDPASIDTLLLFHSFFLLSLEPHSAMLDLQARLGIRPSCAAAIGGQHCASGLAALDVARSLIRAGSSRRALLVGADCFIGSRQREIQDITLQGDGACAVLVEADAGHGELLACGSRVDASLFEGIDAAPALRERFKLTYFLGGHRVISETLRRAGLNTTDVALVVPHNVNAASWTPVLRNLGIPEDRLFAENVSRIGHLSSIDPFANLADVLRTGRARPGDVTLLLAAGLGAVWNCAVLRI